MTRLPPDSEVPEQTPEQVPEQMPESDDHAWTIAHPAQASPLVRVEELSVHFPVRGAWGRSPGHIRAVDRISFAIQRGQTLGLVGESGCGKSTTGRALLRLGPITAGRVWFDDRDLATLSETALRPLRRRMQMVFQDPYASLNPRLTVGQAIAEPLAIHAGAGDRPDRATLPQTAADRRSRVAELLTLVGLAPEFADRYPHEFSGGQRQRIAIARALALHPDFVVCDEPIAALDVSIQAQVINLLQDLQQQLDLTYLFIAHDLSVVRHISDQVAVMYWGRIVEWAPCDRLYAQPLHPYTQALLAAVPIPDPAVEAQRQRVVLGGDVPTARSVAGCAFHPRCPLAEDRCRHGEPPPLRPVAPGHQVACHLVAEAVPNKRPEPLPET